MPSVIERMKPVNRHLLVIPHETRKPKNTSGVLLPEDFEKEKGRYSLVTVIDVASDCASEFKKFSFSNYGEATSKRAIVQTSMLEKVEVGEKKYFLILENYVMGILEAPE